MLFPSLDLPLSLTQLSIPFIPLAHHSRAPLLVRLCPSSTVSHPASRGNPPCLGLPPLLSPLPRTSQPKNQNKNKPTNQNKNTYPSPSLPPRPNASAPGPYTPHSLPPVNLLTSNQPFLPFPLVNLNEILVPPSVYPFSAPFTHLSSYPSDPYRPLSPRPSNAIHLITALAQRHPVSSTPIPSAPLRDPFGPRHELAGEYRNLSSTLSSLFRLLWVALPVPFSWTVNRKGDQKDRKESHPSC